MQNSAGLSSLIRILQYAVGEAKHLGVTEIAWAEDISDGDIVIEVDNHELRSFFQIGTNDEAEINNIYTTLTVVGGKDTS
ncbi:MAG: hypothetical protein KAR80_08365 [Rhodospirillaceae bacterium]|nr:hypothetical protein [Rhodospirillaceae bacterium]